MKPEPEKQSALTIVLFAVYLLLLIGVILFKLPFYSESLTNIRAINLIPLQGSLDGNGNLVSHEVVYNILVFIPLGIYICLLKNNWSFIRKVLPIVGATLAFEVIQFVFAMGITDITDLLSNTLGGIIGIGIGALAFKIFKARTVRIMNLLALVVTVCVVLYFAQLFYLSQFVMRHRAP